MTVLYTPIEYTHTFSATTYMWNYWYQNQIYRLLCLKDQIDSDVILRVVCGSVGSGIHQGGFETTLLRFKLGIVS